jgi:BASS family bile acid:Na+ symporter
MEPRQIVLLVLQISIALTVLGFGLRAIPGDLLYLVRRPALLARALVAVFVVMPIVAVALARAFDFRPTVEIALVILAISPLPPLLPSKEIKAGGHTGYGIGLMAWLGVASIVVIPAALELFQRLTGRELGMAPSAVAGLVLKTVLAPLLAGMALRTLWPALAHRLARPFSLAAKGLLFLGLIVLLPSVLPALWTLVGNGTVFAMLIFTVVGLAVGHVLGGPHPDHSVVLALSTASRHPAIALAIAASNFPDQHLGGTILLFLLVNAIAAVPYLAWQRRHGMAIGRARPSTR